MTKNNRQKRRNRNRRKRRVTRVVQPMKSHAMLVNAINPWTVNPTPLFEHEPGFYNRQTLYLPGEGVAAITTDANGEACFAFQATPGGQFNWVTSSDTAIVAGAWTPDWSAAANDLIDTTLTGTAALHVVTAGFEYLPAIAATAQGGYFLASKYENKTEIAGISSSKIYSGHDTMFNIREPMTSIDTNHFVPGHHAGQTGFGTEIGDSAKNAGSVIVLRFHGEPSTTVGYIHMRQVTEAILDPTNPFGVRPVRHTCLAVPHRSIRSTMPTFF